MYTMGMVDIDILVVSQQDCIGTAPGTVEK